MPSGANTDGGQVNPNLGQPHQQEVPIGEGYQALENTQIGGPGVVRINLEPPFVPGQQTEFNLENGQSSTQKDKDKELWMEKIEEKIKAIQGPNVYGPLGVEELCPVGNVVIPREFKMPDFTKYDGSTNPLLHLRTYCTKMAVWSKDERFLISFFHESLTGPALEWYIQLDHLKIGCWKDLADLFMTQYRFNLDTAPTREQLGLLQKKSGESFKQYAQRWRTLAAQVQPPLTFSEMCSYFLGTLGSPYVGAMAGAAYRDFADLIAAGERIEILARAGKIPVDRAESNLSRKVPQPKNKEPEVNYIQPQQSFLPQYGTPYPRPVTPSYPHPQQTPNNVRPSQFHINHIPTSYPKAPFRPNYTQQRPTYPPNRPNYHPPQPRFQNQGYPRPSNLPPFPKLAIPNSELFQRLFDAHLVSESPMRPMQPPYPAWYNPNLSCKYHMGVAGHSIEDCEAFKTAVRKLIACGRLDIVEEKGPNIVNNPMPNHGGGGQVSAIEHDKASVKLVSSIRTPMREIFEGLKIAGYDVTAPMMGGSNVNGSDEKSSCAYHNGVVGHDIEDCKDFKARVQSLMMLGVIQAGKEVVSEEVDMIQRFVLKVPPGNQPLENEKVVIKVKKPEPFAFKDTHAVPWNYETRVETVGNTSEGHKEGESVVIGGVTRSGRYYNHAELEKKKNDKEEGEEKDENAEKVGRGKDEGEEEFLKIMKQSEYDIIEQLKKTPARVSLFSLILTSEPHRKALLRVLEGAYVKEDVTPQGIVNMVDPVRHVNLITFSDDEISSRCDKNPRALHITLNCRDHIVAKVLIDGGSSLNILPRSTLNHLSIDVNDLIPQEMVVRAFDGSKRGILGEVVLPLKIGPSKFEVLFQVMEMESAYTMLLGRPWIHQAGAVPSTLHQKVKYIENGNVISIRGEEEIMVSKPVSVPYVDNTDQEEKNLWHSFEVVESGCKEKKVLVVDNDEGVAMGCDEKNPSALNVNQVVTQIMAKSGYEEGKGLGLQLQGIQSPLSIPGKLDKSGLGYGDNIEEKFGRMSLGKNGRAQYMPHLRETFPSPAEVIEPDKSTHTTYRLIINAVGGEEPKDSSDICLASDHEPLENWESEPVIDVIPLK